MEDKQWFLYVADHHEGPYTVDEVRKKVKDGEAKDTSYIWKQGLTDWVMMSDSTEFGSGGSKSDGRGFFSFLTGKKPAPVAAVPAAAAQAAAASSSMRMTKGQDIGGVSPSASVWCLNSKKLFTGPHSLKTIVRRINDGDVSTQDSVWKEGWNAFVSISNIPDFMQLVKPDVLQGPKKSKKRSSDVSAAAAAIGMSGTSIRTYRWYKSTPFFFFALFAALVGVYQGLSNGTFDPLLEKTPYKQKVKALALKPIQFEKIFEYVGPAKDFIVPLAQKGIEYLPEPLKGYLGGMPLPENLAPHDAEVLRDVAGTNLMQGVRVASALIQGTELNPKFAVASNLPDGSTLNVVLRGKEGTLLNAFSYEKTILVDINKHIGQTVAFAFDTNKPLPKGEYSLSVYETNKQTPAVVDPYFLGGKKDAAYSARLKEYNDRTKGHIDQEGAELKQLAMSLESMANDSANKFSALSASAGSPQAKASWSQWHVKYQKMSAQMGQLVSQSQDKVLQPLYKKAQLTYQLTERLHRVETDVIEGRAKQDAVILLAPQVGQSVNDLKQEIGKVIK